jgi:sulfate adenylyltransferase subunit 1
MVTGASTANVALILVDARNGVVEQTLRHSFIASLLQIPHIIICVNKMDLVDYSKDQFDKIQQDFEKVKHNLHVKDARFVPISALKGDNVVDSGKENMPWYDGPTLMQLLETIEITHDRNYDDPRFPVQYVIRPQKTEYHDFRGYAGRLAGGVFKSGEKVKVLPSGIITTLASIETMGGKLDETFPPQSVVMTLADDIDISRGDMLVREGEEPIVGQEIDMMICWLSEKPMVPRGKYIVRHTTKEIKGMVTKVDYKINVNTLEKYDGDDNSIGLNEIARISIKTAQPLCYDSYEKNRVTGSLILIDEATNNTVGAGMII